MKALGWIFEAIIDWFIAKVIRVALDWITSMGLSVFGLDLTLFNAYYPYITNTTILIRAIAFALLIVIVTWQLFRAFLGPITDAESPIALIGRMGIAMFSIVLSYDIIEVIRDFAVKPLNAILDRSVLDSRIEAASESFSFEKMFDWMVGGIEQQAGEQLKSLIENKFIMQLIVGILILVIAWNYFKLLLEIIERYVVFGILAYLSPFAFAMSASKSTVNIFKAYLRMFMSEIFLIVMNGWFLYGFNSSVEVFIEDKGVVTAQHLWSTTFLVSGRLTWCLMAIAYLKICQRFDMYLAQLGLNTAQTGGFLAAEIAMAAKTVSNTAGKAFRTGVRAGNMISNARTGGHGGMLGNYIAKRNGQFESRPSTKTISDTAKGMDRSGMFNAFSGGNGAKMSSTEKDYLAGMAAKASDAAKAVNPGLVLGSTNADEAMRALHGGLLSKDNIVPGSSKFSKDTTFGNAAKKIGSAQTTLDYGKFGQVNFSSRMADGNMQSGEFMFKGADGQARYGKLEPADPNNPNNAIAMGAAKAQMLNQSKLAAMSGLSDDDKKAVAEGKKDVSGIGGGALIADGGNVFGSASANDTTGQKILDTLNGVKGSMDKMSGPNVDASAGFAIPAFQGKSVVGEFSQDGFKGVGINPDGSVTPLELTKGMPKDGKQGSAVLDRNGNAYTAKVGGDPKTASASDIQAANQFRSGLNDGKNIAANNVRSNINNAIGGKPAAGFNANTAAGSLAAIAGLNPNGATGTFNAAGGTIKAKDANGNTVTTTLGKSPNGTWNAKSVTTDAAGNVISKSAASGTNAAGVMQAAMNPAGFELGASQKDGGMPSGVDRITSANALDQKVSKLAEDTYKGGVSNLDNLSGINTTQTSATPDGINSNLVLTDGAGNQFSTPFSMKPTYDENGNLTGYTATVGEGKDAMMISGASESEVMGKAMQVANADGIAAGVLSNEGTDADGNPVQAFNGEATKDLLANSAGVNPDVITSAAMTEDGLTASMRDAEGNDISITGNSVADVGNAMKSIENGDMDGAIASGASLTGDGVTDYLENKSGLPSGSLSDASISTDGISGVLHDAAGNETTITAGSMQQFADAANMAQSGDVQGAVDTGAVVSGAAASSYLSNMTGIDSSNIANASVSGNEMSASVMDKNGNEANITANNAGAFNAATAAVMSGKAEDMNNAVAVGASISGNAADKFLSDQAGTSVSNGSISSSGMTGTITDKNGNDTNVSAKNSASFSEAVSAAASGNTFAMAAAMKDGASFEGAAAMSYLAHHGVDTSQMSSASISKDGFSASVGNSAVSAGSAGLLNSAATAVASGDISAINSAISNGATIEGAAAKSVLSQSGIDTSHVDSASISKGSVSATIGDSTVSAGSTTALNSAIQAAGKGDVNAMANAVSDGATYTGGAAMSYLAHNGVDTSQMSSASVSKDAVSAKVGDGTISAGNMNTLNSAVSALSSGDHSAMSSAIENGASISGAAASQYITGSTGMNTNNISNAAVSSDGVSASHVAENGAVSKISAADVGSFASAAQAIENNSSEGIASAVGSGAVVSGAAAASYIAKETGMDASNISNATVSSDGMSASYTTEKGTTGEMSASVSGSNVGASYVLSDGTTGDISASNASTLASAVHAVESNSSAEITSAVESGAVISGAAAASYIAKETGMDTSNISNATVSSDGMSASYTTEKGTTGEMSASVSGSNVGASYVLSDGATGNISASDASTLASAVHAVESNSSAEITSAVESGAVISGAAASSYVAEMSGVNADNVSNAVVSGEGMSASYTAGNGAVSDISAGDSGTFASAVRAVESNSSAEIASAVESGAVISGGAAASYISETTSAGMDRISNAVVSNDGMSASYTTSNGSVSDISADNAEAFESAAFAVECSANGPAAYASHRIESAVESGAVIGGAAATSYIAETSGVSADSVSNAVVSGEGVSASYTAGNGTVADISAGDSATFASAAHAVESGSPAKIASAVESGAVIGGAAATSYVAETSGVSADSISNAVVSGEGVSASYTAGNGTVTDISAGDSATFASAAHAVESNSSAEIASAVESGAVISGAAASTYISTESGIDVRSMSDAVVSQSGIVANVTSSDGSVNRIGAEDTATMAQMVTAVDSSSSGDIQRAINNGGSLSGTAADRVFNDSNSDATYNNTSMSKDSYSSNVENSSGSYSVQSGSAEDMKRAGSFGGDYDSVMRGDYGTSQISGSGSTAAFAQKFGGNESDYSTASFSKNSAYAETKPDSSGNTERLTTVYDSATGGYTTKIETVDRNGSVIFSRDMSIPSTSASKVVAEATASAHAPARVDSVGNVDAKYYGSAPVTMTSKDTGVIKSANGNIENVRFDRSGKNIVAVNGQKLDAKISYTGGKTFDRKPAATTTRGSGVSSGNKTGNSSFGRSQAKSGRKNKRR